MRLKILFSVLLALICSTLLMAQSERILLFDVKVDVEADRSIHVVEKIRVYADGDIIKRGITRSLPETRDLQGKTLRMRYDIIKVERDGREEPYFTQSENGYKVMYIGKEEVFLQPGVYTYTIEYEVPNQVGVFEEYDEIYWNAVGTDVVFNVEEATCMVTLPEGVSVVQEAAYTGRFGTVGKDYTVEFTNSGVFYQTTRPLAPKEGFSVAVGFEKGAIEPPGFFQRVATLITVSIGFLFMIGYFIVTWMKHGVDPPKPTPYPLFEAPDGLSPASINYISKEKYERKSFTASIIKLAIKGYIKIEEEEKKKLLVFTRKVYHLVKQKEADDTLPLEEKSLLENLFTGGRRIVAIDGEYHSFIKHAYDEHALDLSAQHRSFIRKGHNTRFLTVPILTSVAVLALSIFLMVRSPYVEGLSIIPLVAFIPIAIIGISIFAYLIKKPTPAKLDLQSRIEGYKMYLEMAEKDRLRLLNPPEQTPEVFEAALPYAFALGVEHQWAENFKDILEKAQYQPQWTNAHPIYFTNHFGSDFSKTLQSSSTDPSTSSGSGGGGFSGGGGGGGGVGGW
jgi:uncharacterized membrane protein YgcG